MTARLAADGRPVSPEDIRALILRGQDRRAEVKQARAPLDGIPAGQWTDRDVIGGLALLLLSLGAVFTMIGLIDSVIYCCHHWAGVEPWFLLLVLVLVFLGACRRQAVARSKRRAQ